VPQVFPHLVETTKKSTSGTEGTASKHIFVGFFSSGMKAEPSEKSPYVFFRAIILFAGILSSGGAHLGIFGTALDQCCSLVEECEAGQILLTQAQNYSL
jgi:hypothetical protein